MLCLTKGGQHQVSVFVASDLPPGDGRMDGFDIRVFDGYAAYVGM